MTSIVRNIDQGVDMTVSSGCAFALFSSGSVPAIGMIAERSTNPSASFVEVGRLDDIDVGGTVWIDRAPLDNVTRYYRFRQNEPGYNAGPWSDVIPGTPRPIPSIDWSSKPWLLDSSLPLQLVMTIYSETPTTLHVTASRNFDPGGGTPTIVLDSWVGINPPTPTGSGGWVLSKPSESYGLATFRNELTGRQGDYHSLSVQAQVAGDSDTDWLRLEEHVTSSLSLTTVGVSMSVYNPGNVPIGLGIVSSTNVGAITRESAASWTITRPTTGIDGEVTILVTSSIASVISDTTVVVVPRFPGMPQLSMKTHAVNVTGLANEFTASVRVSGSHALPVGTWPVVSASFPALDGMANTFLNSQSISGERWYNYRVSKPNAGRGTGLLTYTATLDGWVRDTDNLTVTDRSTDLATLTVVATKTSAVKGSHVVVAVTATDPLGLVTPTISHSITPGGSLTITGTNPYTVNEPDTGTARVIFYATAANRITAQDALDIDGAARTLEMRFNKLHIGGTAYSFEVTGSDSRGAAPSLLITSQSGVPTVTRLGFGTYTSGSAPQNLPYSYYSASYSASRASVGGNVRAYNFAFSKSGVIGVDDDMIVDPEGVGSTPLPNTIIGNFQATQDVFADTVALSFNVLGGAPSPEYYQVWFFTDSPAGYNQGEISLGSATTYNHTIGGANGHGYNLQVTGTPVTFAYFVQATQSFQQTGQTGWQYYTYYY